MKQNTMKPRVLQQIGGRITADLTMLREVADHISGIFKGVLMRTGITASAVALLAALAAAPSHALPQNGTVAGGSATISQPNSTTMNINQTSGNAIINWQGYNIGANESVKYIQPGSGSIALNRVTGVDPSYIYGLLSGNGQVWVINPNGLLVGPGATIQTGSFLASTMNITNENFMSGRYNFTNSPDSQASIINQGHIQAANGGYVVLAAPSVTNSGSIVANLGKVQLASGDAVTLSIDDASLINVAVSGEVAATALGVSNTGQITADGGQVTLTARVAGDIMKNIVNNEGIIEARSIIEKNGLIILDGGDGGVTSNSGTLDASGKNPGESGGSVTVVGDKVGLFAGSIVDVSGDAGGGTALIGGNFHGEGPEKNASMTYVDKDAVIKADALANGDGGKVVVWSDEATRFYGAISTKGGVQGGDGGNAEVSGKQYLAFDGNVDTNAPKGKTGLLLLDPNDLYVGVNPGGATDVSAGPFQTGGGTADYFVTAGTFSSNTNYTLLAGHDVIFNTDVTFGSGVGNTVSVTAANNIASAGYTVSTSGGALTLNAATMSLGAIDTSGGLLTINNSGAASQSGIFAGTGGLTKSGAGTLTLSQANTYTGATNISAGAVRITVDGGLGTAGGGTTVADGATLALDGSGGNITYNTAEAVTLNGGTLGNVAGTNSFAGAVTLGLTSAVDSTTGTLTLAGVISGTGSLTKSGAGTLVLSAANSYTGATNINAGTVKVTANSGLGTAAGGTTVVGGATLALDGSDVSFTYNTAEAVTLDGGTLGNVAGSNSFAGAVTLSTASSIDSTTGTLELTGVISGTGSLTKSGAGTLLLSTGNIYTGTTAINAGTLRTSGGNAIPNGGTVVLANGATFDLNTSSETIGSLAGNGYVTLGAVGAATLTVGDGTSTNFGGVISGLGGLTKLGSGTLTLSNTNSYEGATTITAGTLRVTANGGLGNVTGGTKVASGATLALDGGVIYSGAEAVTLDFGTLRNLAGSNSFAGALILDNASTIDSTAGTLTLTGGINNLGSLVTFSGAGNTTVSTSGITGGGGLTKTGSGTLILSAANSYAGSTTIDAGTLRLSGGNALANNGVVVLVNTAGAVLDINNSIETIGSLAGGGALGGNVTLGTGTLTIGDGTSTSYGGVISGTGGLTKQGAGSLTLTSTNTYTGTTTINAGTLRLSGGNALADNGAVVLADAAGAVLDLSGTNETIGSLSGGGLSGGDVTLVTATLTVGDGAITSFGGVISGTGGLTKQGAGTLTLTNSNTYSGTTNINGGTLSLSGGSAIADSGVVVLANTAGAVLDLGGSSETIGSLSGGGTAGGNITLGAVGASALTVGDSNTTSYSGVISGAGGLTKQGSGTLTLTNSNTYGGTTTINGGTLLLSGGSALADNGAVVLANAAGAILDLNGTSETIGSLSGGGPLGGTVALGAANLTVGNETSTSFGGVINGTGGLIKQGSGMLTLANTNTYTGNTSINAGTLRLSGNNAIADTSAVVLADTGGAILDLNSSSETIGSLSGGGSSGGNVTLGTATLTVVNSAATSFGGVISGNGGLTKLGSGTLTLTNTNMYDGTTSINAGTLRVTADGGLGSATGGTTVAGGAKLALDGSGSDITYNTAEAVTLNGGTLGNVAGYNSFAGPVTLSANSAIDSTAGTLTLTGGVTNGGFLATFSGAGTTAVSTTKITGIGGLTKTGSGTLILSAANDYTGTTTVNAGTLQLSGGSAIADTGAVVLANTVGAVLDLSGSSETISSLSGGGDTGGSVTLNGATLRVGNDTSTSFDGIISGSGSLTKQGSGTLTLTNSNTYSGATNINGGTLSLSGGNAIGDSSAVVLANASGAVLDLNSSNETIGSLSGGGTSGGSVTLGTGSLTVGNDASTSFGGVISGAGGLTKQGSGTLTLANSNIYTGTTDIIAGTLRVTTDSGLGSAAGGTNVANGATLALNGTGINVTYNTPETVILNGGTLSNVAGTNSFAGMVALGANSAIDSTVGTLTLTGGVNNGGYLATFSGAGNTNISTTGITGGGGLIKQGTGTLILSAANDYTGVTNINAGTLRLSGGSAIADTGSVVLADAIASVLDLSGSSETIGSLSGGGASGGNVSLGLGTLTVGNISSTSFGGVISGSGGLTKQGAGTLTLTNTNLYDGATIVNNGTLRVTANSGLGSAAGGTTVASGATLALDGNGGNVVYNTAEAIVLNGGTLGNVAGTNSFAGPVTLGAASSIDSTAGTLTLTGGVSNNGYLATFSGAGNTNIVTTGITGVGGLTKNGAGTLILSAANDYSGATTVNAGTLQLSSGSAISDTGTVVLANRAGAVLNLSGSSETIGSLSGGGILGGNVTLDAVTLTVGDETSSIFSGVISGSGGLTKQGSGMLTLTNSNTFDGVTRINAGTLRVTADGGLGSAAGGTTVANGATVALDGTGTNLYYGTAEALTLNGGTLSNLAGTNSFTGALTVSTGGGTINILAGSLNLLGAVDGSAGGGGLVINGNGTLTLGNKVGNTAAIGGLTTAAGVKLFVNGGIVMSTGAQTYHDDVTIGTLNTAITTANSNVTFDKSVTLNKDLSVTAGSGAITFTGAVDGANSLTTDSSGLTTFTSTIGHSVPLLSLTIGTATPGMAAINGGEVRTTGNQTYNNAVVLGIDTTLTSSSGAIKEGPSGSLASTGLLTTRTSSGQDLVGNGSNAISNFNATNTTRGDIKLTNISSPLNIAGISQTGGNLIIVNSGEITSSGPLTVTGDASISAAGQSITLTNIDNDFSGTLSVSGATTQITDKNDLAVNLDTSGPTTLAAGADMTLSGTSTDSVTATAVGDVTLSNPAASILHITGNTIVGTMSNSSPIDLATTSDQTPITVNLTGSIPFLTFSGDVKTKIRSLGLYNGTVVMGSEMDHFKSMINVKTSIPTLATNVELLGTIGMLGRFDEFFTVPPIESIIVFEGVFKTPEEDPELIDF